MSLDYLGSKKIKKHEEEQDNAISSGGSSVQVINTDQFALFQESLPVPSGSAIDDITENGTYLINLDLSTMGMSGMGMSWTLTVNNMGAASQSLSISGMGIVLTRSISGDTWGDWQDNSQIILKSIAGFDATKTQVLKNVNGVLAWVTE